MANNGGGAGIRTPVRDLHDFPGNAALSHETGRFRPDRAVAPVPSGTLVYPRLAHCHSTYTAHTGFGRHRRDGTCDLPGARLHARPAQALSTPTGFPCSCSLHVAHHFRCVSDGLRRKVRPIRGTVVAATMYTILETTKLNEVEPRADLRSVVAAHLRGKKALPPILALNPGLRTITQSPNGNTPPSSAI